MNEGQQDGEQGAFAELIELVANLSEAHTAAFFALDERREVLTIRAHHSLSREFNPRAEIPVGSGLIGWTAENRVRVSVCPFDHDARTLLCYRNHEPLKSFIAVPVLSAGSRENGKLLGVIACDSMKSYAFPKVTEKLLEGCARQAATFVELYRVVKDLRGRKVEHPDGLETFAESLRGLPSEKSLFARACEIPQSLVRREALVILSLSRENPGEGAFFTGDPQGRVGNRLLDLVCKHKKLICGERVVRTSSADDASHRSFLSVPFRILDSEAGSFNLLSQPNGTFHATEVGAVERIAAVLGQELERVRLRQQLAAVGERGSLCSWRTFSLQSRKILGRDHSPLCLVRLTLTNLPDLERLCGTAGLVNLLQHVSRLWEQARRSTAPACSLPGEQLLLLAEPDEAKRSLHRFMSLLNRLPLEELGRFHIGGNPLEVLKAGMQVTQAVTARDGSTLEDLLARSIRPTVPAGEARAPLRRESGRGWVFSRAAHA